MSLLDRLTPERRAWLEERVIERDGCLVWTLAMNNASEPRTHINRKTVPVRRLIYDLTHDANIRSNECALVQPECCPGCVHPDHVRNVSRKSLQKGKKHNLDHVIAIAKARRAKTKITPEQVRKIRESPEPHSVLAERFGIHKSYVGYIRSHRNWKNYSSHWAGLFSGLLSANDSQRRAA